MEQPAFRLFDLVVGLPLQLKLMIIATVCTVPTIFLSSLYIPQLQKEISHAAGEIEGTKYLEPVWASVVQSARSRTDTTTASAENVAAVKASAQRYDSAMKSGASTLAFIDALQRNVPARDAVSAGITAIQKIGDGSGLFLAPELQSVYLMDTGVMRLPELLAGALATRSSVETLATAQPSTSDQKTALILALGRVESASAIIAGNYRSSFNWNTDGTLKAALAKLAEDHSTATAKFQSAARRLAEYVAQDKPLTLGLAAFSAAYTDLTTKTDVLWKATNAQLRQLANARRTALTRGVNDQIRAIFLVFAVAALIVIVVARSIQSPIASLVAGMNNVRQGNFGFPVPHLKAHNEIGDIARAVDESRLASVQLKLAQQQQEKRLQDEAEQAARTQAFLAELKGVISAARDGEFSLRMSDGKQDGFTSELSSALNEMTGQIGRNLDEAVQVMGAIAKGRLSQRMTGENYKGHFLRLKTDVNSMADEISAIVNRIGDVAQTVQDATQKIGAGVNDLLTRTEQQAAALEETTASMEEMSATVRQNAGNAQEAQRTSMTARDLSIGGTDIARKAVGAMGKIDESSRKIADIVALIEEIAFQTNILSLNAAVEAARAGEAGRGFAVVASEVRALSQRSAHALKDVKVLISHADANVKAGVEMVIKAGAALDEMTQSTKLVSEYVSEIATASHEQAQGIYQVSNAITDMDQMTQQNALLVEETSKVLQLAQTKADELTRAVAYFETGAKRRATPEPQLPAFRNPARPQKTIAIKNPNRSSRSSAATALANDEWREF